MRLYPAYLGTLKGQKVTQRVTGQPGRRGLETVMKAQIAEEKKVPGGVDQEQPTIHAAAVSPRQ